MAADFRYRAFISYSHRDRRWGEWLHRSLESYRVPRRLVGTAGRDGPVPRRLTPVFRDREELPTASDLTENIARALSDSATLIVICSPDAADSRWVNEEVKAFKAMGRADRVLCLIVGGEPNASDKGDPALECFPEAIRYPIGADRTVAAGRTEPIAADARPGGDGRSAARLKLVSGILGVNYDSLRQRERRRRRARRAIVGAGASALLLAASSGVFLLEQQQQERLYARTLATLDASYERTSEGRHALAVQLARTALEDVEALDLGRFTRRLESFIDVPLSARAERDRRMTVAAQARLTEAAAAHPVLIEGAGAKSLAARPAPAAGVAGSVVSLNEDGVLELVDADGGSPRAFRAPRGMTFSHAVANADASRVLAFFEEGGARLFDGRTTRAVPLSLEHPIRHGVFAPDGRRLAVDQDADVVMVDARDGRVMVTLPGHGSRIEGLSFDPAGERLVIVGDKGFRVYDLQKRPRRLDGVFDGTAQLTFGRDRNELFSLDRFSITDARTTNAVRIWDLARGVERRRLDAPGYQPDQFQLSDDGNRLLTLAAGDAPRSWDARSGEFLQAFEDEEGPATAAVLDPGGRLVAARRSGGVDVRDAVTGELRHQFAGHKAAVTAMRFDLDGARLLLGYADGTARGFDMASGAQLFELSRHDDRVTGVAFAPFGRRVATRSADGTARVWTLDGAHVLTLSGHERDAGTVEYSPDGRRLLTTEHADFSTGLDNNHVRVWDARTGELVHELAGHHGIVRAAFSADGTRFITSADASRVWDTESGELVGVAMLPGAALSPDGQRLATREGAGITLVDLAPPGLTLRQHADALVPARLSDADRARYLPEAPPLLGY